MADHSDPDYFKVIYIKSTREVEPVPHQWEKNGTVYWPPTKGQVRKEQSNAASIPDKKIWKKYECLVKATNIHVYMHASAQADRICALEDSSSSDYSTTDDEKGKVITTKSLSTFSNKRSSVLKKNIPGLPAYDFHFNKQKEKPIDPRCAPELPTSPTRSASSDGGISENEKTLVNDYDIVLEKLSLLQSKVDEMSKDLREFKEKILEKIVEKFADVSVRLNNLDGVLKKTEYSLTVPENELQIFPINLVSELEKLEKDLEDKSFKKKVFGQLTRSIGSALPHKTACYRLAGVMFTREVLTKYSWTGMSKSLEKKAFNRLTGILDLFYNVVFKSDNSFTYPARDSFFRDCILKHSNTRLKNKKGKTITETQEPKVIDENLKGTTENQEPQDEESVNSVNFDDSLGVYEVYDVEENGEITLKEPKPRQEH